MPLCQKCVCQIRLWVRYAFVSDAFVSKVYCSKVANVPEILAVHDHLERLVNRRSSGTYVVCMYVCVRARAHIHTHTHTSLLTAAPLVPMLCVCMYVCMYVCVRARAFIS